MHQGSILAPLRFKFTDERDAKAYGNPDDPGGWWTYDETAFAELPNEKLFELERHLGSIPDVLQGGRDQTVLGGHKASWMVIHRANPDVAGEFRDYQPRALLIYWEHAPADEPASADPLDSSSSPSSPPTE